jgi:hypothetical protein
VPAGKIALGRCYFVTPKLAQAKSTIRQINSLANDLVVVPNTRRRPNSGARTGSTVDGTPLR